MADSVVAICNKALDELGQQPITSLTDATRRARACNRNYGTTRDDVLSEHPWNEAEARVELAALATAPEFEFTHEFQLPSDFLNVVHLYEYSDDYAVEGNKLLANSAPIKLIYTRKITDVGSMKPPLKTAIALKLAERLALELTGSGEVRDRMEAKYMKHMETAQWRDSSQAPSHDQIAGSTWIDARRHHNADDPVYRKIEDV